ncbi:ATP phosphoribosyltransferase regulatory subunit [Pokkaliibacter sp. MBI-7]|uniref:ATP phosphoribosyltransferase regulatory subunit n=1 Tax=Pokkaliibacter sp. MBI-7 TaxID=3040600 RepID=UPI002447E140|nr:ATP phosphoribosyltransferase regulatory subunit [Pokkaliibacter sp. MBI-7]MDH2432217.1 ATP phosphoribosyltransferase regulatory subunit [Pokkaliibacter sp. MBI-7]
MTLADRWLLPDGVKEVLPPEAERIESVRRQLLDLYRGWGYDLVMTPLIEYLESLLTGTGHDLELLTFKVTDQLTGRMMGVRADITPQVARIDAHCLHNTGVVRLCYASPVLHTRPAYLQASRNPLQLGAELYGHDGAASDVEVIQLMLETLRTTGVRQAVTLDLNQVNIYRQLARHAGLDAQQAEVLTEILQRKSLTELRSYVAAQVADKQAAEWLLALARLNGDVTVLQQAEALFADAPAGVRNALANLRDIVEAVQQYSAEVDIYIDLSELRGYNYHTGIIFTAYVPGYGQPVAKGGRYDDIGRVFGRARPATGFSADLMVLVALSDQVEVELPKGIYAPANPDALLSERIAELRVSGERVVAGLPGMSDDPRELRCDRQLQWDGEQWQVVSLAN